MKLVPVEVRSYSGIKADETPRAFTFQGKVYQVIVHQLALELMPDGRRIRRFEVTSGDQRFCLAFEETVGAWFLVR
jgi:hypothetical protein